MGAESVCPHCGHDIEIKYDLDMVKIHLPRGWWKQRCTKCKGIYRIDVRFFTTPAEIEPAALVKGGEA